MYVDKCIRSNDRVLVYTNTASSRQEGSLTGLWCSHYARMVRAVRVASDKTLFYFIYFISLALQSVANATGHTILRRNDPKTIK